MQASCVCRAVGGEACLNRIGPGEECEEVVGPRSKLQGLRDRLTFPCLGWNGMTMDTHTA
jgi:hypothetical protein